MAREDLAPSFSTADQHPPVIDPVTHEVAMPSDFAKAYEVYMNPAESAF